MREPECLLQSPRKQGKEGGQVGACPTLPGKLLFLSQKRQTVSLLRVPQEDCCKDPGAQYEVTGWQMGIQSWRLSETLRESALASSLKKCAA